MRTRGKLTILTLVGLGLLDCSQTTSLLKPAISPPISPSPTGNNSGQPPTGYHYTQPSKSLCDVTLDFDNGFLCAIKPSRLDPDARDTYFDATHTTAQDRYYGFGYHAIVFPKNGTDIKGVYIHFKGSYGRPYSQDTGKFADKTFLKESASSGFLMIQPAYSNRFPINADECGNNKTLDNCAGRVREDKITGLALSTGDLAGTTIEKTPLADSIEERMRKLVGYLESNGFKFPVEVATGSTVFWKNVRVGGHSQGSGHAAYIGKIYGTEHVCLLAGIHDTNDDVNNPPGNGTADWLLISGSKTPVEKMRAALCEDDPMNAGFKLGLSLFGMIQGTHYSSRAIAGGYFDEEGASIDAHSAPVTDPRFKEDRATACFSP